MRKRGAVDWTIGKLLRLVLLVLVLALVAYGVSTQSLNPLIESIGGKIDEVKIMLHLKEDIYSKECYVENIVDLGGGKEFLKEIGMEGKDVVLNVCKNRICNISSRGAVSYRVREGELERMGLSEWTKYDSAFVGDLSFIKFSWELYNVGVDILDREGIKKLYDETLTRKFVLYGDGEGPGDEVFAAWQDNYWIVVEGNEMPNVDGWIKEGNYWVTRNSLGEEVGKVKNLYNGDVDNLAINAFKSEVWETNDDKVYWKELNSGENYDKNYNRGESIETLVSNIGVGSSPGELDDDKEVEKLKEEFAKRKEKYLKEARLSDEDLKLLRERVGGAVDNGRIKIGDKEFVVEVEENAEFPIISFSFGKEKHGLKRDMQAKVVAEKWKEWNAQNIKLRTFPISLVEWNSRLNKWEDVGTKEYYRLSKNNFEEVYRATLISQFLESKCK